MSRAFIEHFPPAPRSIFSGPAMKIRRPMNRRCAILVPVFLAGVAATFDINLEK